MKTPYILNFLVLSMLAISACTDVIDVKTNQPTETQLSIDAWITDESKPQTIKLTLTQPYFDQGPTIPAKGGSVFVVSQDSIPYEFKDLKNDGTYVWQPATVGDKILTIGKQYLLYVKYEGEEYISISKVNRVPAVDSINYYKEELPFKPADNKRQVGYQADFYGRDFVGMNDCYWIRAYRNDTLFNKPSQISVAYDAGFSAGGAADGLLFILPLRASISPELYGAKDKVRVEVYSIPVEAFYFLQLVRQESSNGGIFATIPSNIPSNIQNRNTKSTKKPLGFFAVSAVSKLETVINPNKAIPKPPNR
jgi:hypothetical protein